MPENETFPKLREAFPNRTDQLPNEIFHALEEIMDRSKQSVEFHSAKGDCNRQHEFALEVYTKMLEQSLNERQQQPCPSLSPPDSPSRFDKSHFPPLVGTLRN
jgi:hypothetical protein